MMTNEQIWHILGGFFLFLITLELFPKNYFYTRSEVEILERSRGSGIFSLGAISRILGAMTGMGLVCFTFVKYFS